MEEKNAGTKFNDVCGLYCQKHWAHVLRVMACLSFKASAATVIGFTEQVKLFINRKLIRSSCERMNGQYHENESEVYLISDRQRSVTSVASLITYLYTYKMCEALKKIPC